MKKVISLTLTATILAVMLTGCINTAPAKSTEAPVQAEEPAAPQPTPFKYKHDPRENPRAMEDIVEDPDAVYGFLPNPGMDACTGLYDDYFDLYVELGFVNAIT